MQPRHITQSALPSFPLPTKQHTWLKKIGRWLLHLLVGTAALGTLIGFLGQLWWVFDGASHFRVQYLLVLFLGALIFFLTKRTRRTILSSLLCLLNLALIVPTYLGTPAPSTASSYRLLMANVEYVNFDHQSVKEFIDAADADILILQEFTPTWEEQLSYLESKYPHFTTHPRTDAWGIALYSRIPFTGLEVDDPGPRTYPSIFANYDLDGSPITIIGTHPPHPIEAHNVRDRDIQLGGFVEFAGQHTGPLLLCGDFNTTPWSINFREFLRDTHLTNAAQGFGFQPTWPTNFFPILIPFDHCLASPHVLIHNFDTGPNIGSDHYPILVDFSLQP